MESLMALPPILLAVVGLLLLTWVVLLFLVPFIVEGIRTWTRRNYEELRSLNQKIERLTAALESRRDALPPQMARTPAERVPGLGASTGRAPGTQPTADRPAATRREPTLSELPVDTGQDRRPRR